MDTNDNTPLHYTAQWADRPAAYDPAIIGLVTMERPAPSRSAWVTLRFRALHTAEPHAKGAGHEESTVCRSRCARGHDRGRRGGAGGAVRSVGVIPNRPESIRKLVKRLGPEQLRVCYEAGPTGYVIYWQLTALGVRCEVVAPTLVPVQAGDRVKTDRGVVARILPGPHALHRPARHKPMRYDAGLPSSVIRFRMLQARTASHPCPAGLRARRPLPMIDLYRKKAFSTRAC